MFKELYRIEILFFTIFIWNPLSVFFAIIKIKHGSDRIHTYSVYMELSYPEKSICNKEIFHLGFTQIKNLGSPIGMLALSRVGIFINAFSVKTGKPEFIRCKMRGNPVKYYSYVVLVKLVDKIHKVRRLTVS